MQQNTNDGAGTDGSDEQSPWALLLDFDGVVVNSRKAAYRALGSVLGEHKKKLSPALFSRFCVRGRPDSYIEPLLEALGGTKTSGAKLAEDLASGIVMNMCSGDVKVTEGLVALVEAAAKRGIPVAAMTSLAEDEVESVAKKRGLDAHEITLASPTGKPGREYPRTDGWLKLARSIKRVPRRCVVLVGCQAACKTALAAGMRCIALPDEFTSFQDFSGSEMVLDALTDVPAKKLLDQVCPVDV